MPRHRVPPRGVGAPLTLHLSPLSIEESPRLAGWVRLTGTLDSDVDGRTEALWIEVRERDASGLVATGDAFLAWLAPVAALRREPLRLTPPVDALLLEGTREVMRVWASWYPELQAVSIEAPWAVNPRQAVEGGARAVGSMFTGGVDSFFTVLRHDAMEGTPTTQVIDDLLFVHGFDVPLANVPAWTRVTQSLQQAAESLDKRLVLLATNLRQTRFGSTDWPRLSHGAALAGVAHALGGRYGTVLIGSSAGYRDLRPWGSHPLTDPMFSSSRVRILHDGGAFMRVEKTEYVARSPIAMRHLRVCWKSQSGDNCGVCNNCYRTMLALEALGVLGDSGTFDRQSLDLRQASRIYCRHDFDYRQFGYVRDLAARERRPDIAAAVNRSLRGSQRISKRVGLLGGLRERRLLWRVERAWERLQLRGWID